MVFSISASRISPGTSCAAAGRATRDRAQPRQKRALLSMEFTKGGILSDSRIVRRYLARRQCGATFAQMKRPAALAVLALAVAGLGACSGLNTLAGGPHEWLAEALGERSTPAAGNGQPAAPAGDNTGTPAEPQPEAQLTTDTVQVHTQ